MNDLLKKIAGEVANGKELEDVVNHIDDDEIKKFIIEIYGINEKIFDICPGFLKKFDTALGAIAEGEPAQRETAVSFVDNMERIGVIKPGSSLVILDKYYKFNETKYEDFKDKTSKEKKQCETENFKIELPDEKGLSKEEVENDVIQQLKKQGKELPSYIQKSVFESVWKSYQEIVGSEQEENSNV